MAETVERRIADEVHARLRDEIIDGSRPAGMRLSVPAIAERFRVSRSPVRDAVLRLIQDRLAKEEPRRGAVVASIGLEELAALYEVREVLEGLAARLAVENAGRRLVRALREVLTEHEDAVSGEDLKRHTEADMRFHALIREAAGNSEAIRLLEEIQTRVRLAMRTTSHTAGPRRAMADHQAILRAIDAGDAEAAEAAARAHVARLREALLAQAGEAVAG